MSYQVSCRDTTRRPMISWPLCFDLISSPLLFFSPSHSHWPPGWSSITKINRALHQKFDQQTNKTFTLPSTTWVLSSSSPSPLFEYRLLLILSWNPSFWSNVLLVAKYTIFSQSRHSTVHLSWSKSSASKHMAYDNNWAGRSGSDVHTWWMGLNMELSQSRL